MYVWAISEWARGRRVCLGHISVGKGRSVCLGHISVGKGAECMFGPYQCG